MNFDRAFELLLGHEGGYSEHPRDPGKATKWGITERVARAAGYAGRMQDFPVDAAKAIAKQGYWDAVQADQLPPELRYAMFDAAYNSGPAQATLWLQRALNVRDDGVLGPKTLSAAQIDPISVKARMLGLRLEFLTDLPTWDTFGKGWSRRIAKILAQH